MQNITLNRTSTATTQSVNLPAHNFIAIDLHSNTAVVCVKVNAVDQHGIVIGKTIHRSTVSIYDGLDAFIKLMEKFCQGQQHTAIVESTYNWYSLADAFEERGWVLRIADPSTVSQANIKASDDKTDADYLAERLRVGAIKTYAPLSKNKRAIRDLCRVRMSLVQNRASAKITLVNMFRNHLSTPASVNDLVDRALEAGVAGDFVDPATFTEFDTLFTQIKAAVFVNEILHLTKLINWLDSKIQAECKEDELARLCRSIPGCGPVLSSVISTEIGNMDRFKAAGDFVSYCRLCSTSKLSNGKSKGMGNAKNGNAYLSWAFTEVAQHALSNKTIKRKFEKLLDKYNGLRVKAIRTLAAKIARAAFYVLKNKQVFELRRCFSQTRTRKAKTTMAPVPAN